METVERITHFGEFCFVFVMNDMFVPLVKNAIKVVFVWYKKKLEFIFYF